MGNRFATIDMGRKLRGRAPFGGGAGQWAPSNTMSSATTPTSVPNGILIHPTVLPQ